MSGIFSKVKNFLNRHKNKFIVTGTIVGGVYLASRYAQYKLREWQERETKDFLERTRKSQHFESTERTCNQTIISLSATLNDTLSRLLSTEEIVAQLRDNPTNKIELWDRMKLLVFAKVCTLVYVNVLLVLVLRIQLNLIGGYLYKDTKAVTSSMQQNYLSLCHILLETGLEKISTIITEKVTEILSDFELKKKLSLYDVEQLFWSIQVKLCDDELDPIKHIRQYVITDDISDSQDLYHSMVRETADLLESEEARSLATTCTNRGFSFFIDKLSEFYSPNGAVATPGSSRDTFLHPSKIQIPLAKLIPIFNGLLTRNSFPEVFTQQLINEEKMKLLGANIYEVFSHR